MKKLIILLLIGILATGCTNNSNTNIVKEEINETVTEEKKEVSTEKDVEAAENTENKKPVIAPDFELQSLDGTTVKLSDLKDYKVIINFWATWCSYCVEEMPDLQKLQDTYKDDNLIILAINVGESKEIAKKFVNENNLTLNVLLDEDMNVANTYGVRSFPSTLAINEKGEAIAGHIGMLTYEQMEQIYGFFSE